MAFSYFKADEIIATPHAGDFILTHGSGWLSAFIRFGQTWRFKGADSVFAHWNHAAFIEDDNGYIIEALSNGVYRRHLSSYTAKEYVVVHVEMSEEDRKQAVEFARSCIGKRYGFVHFFSIGLSLLTGLNFNFGFDAELICSGLVAKALERAGFILPRDCSYNTPADLAKFFKVKIPQV